MDTGYLRKENDYYSGYEGEPELVISSISDPQYSIHIWEGYIEDILHEPYFIPEGWSGFTKDYQECLGAWGDDQVEIIKDIPTYIEDLMKYKDKSFAFKRTPEVYADVLALLSSKEAKNGIKVEMM